MSVIEPCGTTDDDLIRAEIRAKALLETTRMPHHVIEAGRPGEESGLIIVVDNAGLEQIYRDSRVGWVEELDSFVDEDGTPSR